VSAALDVRDPAPAAQPPATLTILGAVFTRSRSADHLSPAWYEATLYGHPMSVWAPLAGEGADHSASWSVGPIVVHGHGADHQAAVVDAVAQARTALGVLRATARRWRAA
jgi:hypothetical protein